MMAGKLTIDANLAFEACGEGTCGYCGMWTLELFQICMEIGGEEHVIERNNYPFEICRSCQPKVHFHIWNVKDRHR